MWSSTARRAAYSVAAAALVMLVVTSPSSVVAAMQPGILIKASQPAVYYLAGDGKRYVFPNERAYKTWFADFSRVTTVTDAELATIPIGSNVTYRPGVKLVKVQTDPKVYAVAGGGTLRWLQTEDVAVALYGAAWAANVDDVPDAFFVNYAVGAPIAVSADFSPSAARDAATTIGADRGVGPATDPVTVVTVPTVGSCRIFPADNQWNADVSSYPVHPDSATFMASIGLTRTLHPDFGSNPDYGIPVTVVDASQPDAPITFDAYGDESDPGPYPVPANARVEAGGDRHVIVLDKDACKLYELYAARKDGSGAGWTAESGAVFDLASNALRPEGWTSADAAGLPIYPGLVKYDEVASGAMRHAIRFTASRTQRGYIHPATHQAGVTGATYPPMGLRVRLKADFDISGYDGHARVILETMRKYGMILADNGSNWFFTGETDSRWDDDDLNQLKSVPGSAFEAVYTGPIIR